MAVPTEHIWGLLSCLYTWRNYSLKEKIITQDYLGAAIEVFMLGWFCADASET